MSEKLRRFGLAVLMILALAAVLLGGDYVMTTASGHAVVVTALEGSADTYPPLNERPAGYNADDVRAVWRVIADTPGGPQAERAYLQMDLVFPIVYGGALLLCLTVMIRTVGAERYRRFILVPVAFVVVSDWTENIIHLRQFNRFVDTSLFSETAMRLAGAATMFKFTLILVCVGLIVWLAIFYRAKAR